jgi:branched-chain amino acid transport system substrate-binding protein
VTAPHLSNLRSSRKVGPLLLVSAIVILSISPARVGADDRSIAIGLDLPLSGIDGASSIPVRNAILLAIDEANRRGVPGGFHLTLEDLDDSVQGKHDPAQGAQNFKSFVADASVLVALGPMNSNVAKAEIPISNAAGLAQITMGATAVELTHAPDAVKLRPENPGRNAFFRVCASDDRQGAAAASFARTQRFKNAFVIDDNESYGKGLADEFAASFARDGGSVIGREHLTAFELDFKPLLTKVRATNPDMIFFGGIVSTGGAILRRQMADVGLGGVPYFGGDGLESPEYLPLAGKAADGTFFTLASPNVEHLPAAVDFAKAYQTRFGSAPGSYSPGGYAAAAVAIAAIEAALRAHPAQIPTRDDVLGRVGATSGLVTPVGPISFDRQGDLRHPVISLYRIRGGRVEFVGQTGV